MFFLFSFDTSDQLHLSIKSVFFIYESIFYVQEYEGDGIDWKKIEFKDNKECLDLIEKVIYSLPPFKFATHLVFLHVERDGLMFCSKL